MSLIRATRDIALREILGAIAYGTGDHDYLLDKSVADFRLTSSVQSAYLSR